MNELANNFFKNGDKAYSENLNDSILVGNAFDWTVTVSLPTDTGGVFPNSSTVVKGKVADCSISPNSNLSIGSTISNSSGSSQVYRLTVYPNFNRFGGFKSISVTGDCTFYIANKGGTNPIANNLDYSDLSDVPELKVLKEYDIVLTIANNKSVSGLEFVFQSSNADVNGIISQENVSGITDLVYPVGSIYMSVNSTSPATLFGGTWEQLKDKFLLSAGTTYSAGSTGGESTHTLTKNEMPSHTHEQYAHNHDGKYHSHSTSTEEEYFVTSEISTANNTSVSYNASGNRIVDGQTTGGSSFHHREATSSALVTLYEETASNKNTGGGQSHNNMPPYLAVYMWKRTA